jgi:hypothetical protein
MAAKVVAAALAAACNALLLQETASKPEFAGLWAEEGKGAGEGGRRLKLTKLELKMMEEARKRQKENIVQPQVVVAVVVLAVNK